MNRVWIPQAVVSFLLALALSRQPYGYYIFLRWVCCPVFAYLALKALDASKERWAWVLGITAVIYNPIIRVHLTRDLWSVINVLTIVVAIASIFAIKAPQQAQAPRA